MTTKRKELQALLEALFPVCLSHESGNPSDLCSKLKWAANVYILKTVRAKLHH
jgi:hypothetical protein